MSEVARAERLFVGVPIAAGIREKLIRKLPSNLPGKLSPPENWHFTLRFLGPTLPDKKHNIIDQLRAIDFGRAFHVQFDALGAFPNAGRAKVVWLGVGKGADRLSAIATAVERAAVLAGFEAEHRRFSPHLTLSRLKDPESVTQLLIGRQPLGETMRVDQVVLYESRMGGPHSRYSVVKAFPLD